MSRKSLEFTEVNFFVDKPVELVLHTGDVFYGTVRFVGYTSPTDKFCFVGLELPHPTGDTNGKLGDVTYFRCKPNHGHFFPLSDIDSCKECPPSILRKEKTDFRQFQQSQRRPKVSQQPPKMASDLVNQTVTVARENGDRDRGVVRFQGHTAFADGEWFGVELFERTGRNDGSINGVPYFQCQMGFGIFVRETSISLRMEDNEDFTPHRRQPPPATFLAVQTDDEPRGLAGDRAMQVDDLDAETSPHARPPFAVNQTPPPVVDDSRPTGNVPVIDNPFNRGGAPPGTMVDGDAVTPIIDRDANNNEGGEGGILQHPNHGKEGGGGGGGGSGGNADGDGGASDAENELPFGGTNTALSPADRRQIVRALDRTVQAQVKSKTERQLAELAEKNRRLQKVRTSAPLC